MKKIISLLFIFGISCSIAYADFPKTLCNSVCPNTSGQYTNSQALPIGAKCIYVGKHKIYYRTSGKGSPTIIFSSGTGFPADGWFEAQIASIMAKKVKVFVYDRVFTFNSCPNLNDYMPETAQDIVEQLHILLRKANIKPPYILVGHSFGGLYMLLYARKFPSEVAGLLLMDASSPAGPTPFPQQSKKILRELGNPQNPTPENPLYNEMIGQLPSYLQIQNAPPLQKNMPLIVMYSTEHCLPIAWTKEKMCMSPDQEKNYQENQLRMAKISKNYQIIRIEGDHSVFFTKNGSKRVIKALNSML